MAEQPVTATEDQIAFYQKNGFVKFENVLPLEEVEAFRKALAEATSRPGEGYFFNKGVQYTQHVNVWTMGEAIRQYVFNPTLANIARQLTRSAQVRLWHDQEIIKMPGDRPSSWHQDLTVWPMLEAGPLTCWLALVDVPVEMGCMSFLPGSQRWGRLATASLPGIAGRRAAAGAGREARPAPAGYGACHRRQLHLPQLADAALRRPQSD